MLQFGELPAALKSVATQPLLVIARHPPHSAGSKETIAKLDAGSRSRFSDLRT
jgi:hypothetical protein